MSTLPIREDITLIEKAIDLGWKPYVRKFEKYISVERVLKLAHLGYPISFTKAFNKENPKELTYLCSTSKGWQMSTVIEGYFKNHYINKKRKTNKLPLNIMLLMFPMTSVTA